MLRKLTDSQFSQHGGSQFHGFMFLTTRQFTTSQFTVWQFHGFTVGCCYVFIAHSLMQSQFHGFTASQFHCFMVSCHRSCTVSQFHSFDILADFTALQLNRNEQLMLTMAHEEVWHHMGANRWTNESAIWQWQRRKCCSWTTCCHRIPKAECSTKHNMALLTVKMVVSKAAQVLFFTPLFSCHWHHNSSLSRPICVSRLPFSPHFSFRCRQQQTKIMFNWRMSFSGSTSVACKDNTSSGCRETPQGFMLPFLRHGPSHSDLRQNSEMVECDIGPVKFDCWEHPKHEVPILIHQNHWLLLCIFNSTHSDFNWALKDQCPWRISNLMSCFCPSPKQ